MKFKWLPLMCFLFAGCSEKKRHHKQSASFNYIHQQEAKFFDIPIPLNAVPISRYFDKNRKNNTAIVMGYSVYLSLQEVTLFYTLEMERLGWRQIALFDNNEILINFEKPGHICNISIRSKSSKNKKVKMLIFVSKKEDFNN